MENTAVSITAPIAVNLTEEQLSRFTGYPVTLPVFAGPLDLLLYLIKRQEIDITDIPIALVTAQFLDYLALMEALDVELASDFIVMAATLLEIKSRMLLPRPPALVDEEDVEEEDPRAELVRRLVEYQQYKSAAQSLAQRADEQSRVFPRTTAVEGLPLTRMLPELDGDVDAFTLWTALQEVLARVEAVATPAVREVTRPKITIRKQMLHILHLLSASPEGVTFTAVFFYEGREHPLTRMEVIVTFLAMLELIRLKRLVVAQRSLFGEILLKSVQGALPVM
ncbi:MAG: Segregation and condensation protein A [bacterium ADurb.Bin429]|nr:MAG: Segregation and condensation protein A [bacterium ADurb.Bin429]